MESDRLIYIYDSSFDGLLTCIYEAFEQKDTPIDISSDPYTLLPKKIIETDLDKAAKIKKSIKRKLGENAYQTIIYAFLSREIGVESDILSFIKIGLPYGTRVLQNLNDPIIAKMFFLYKKVSHEKHRIIEFLRFSDYNGNLISVINPKYFVLPLIASHFTNRYPNENFLIFDEVHLSALIYADKCLKIMDIDEFTMPQPTEEEVKFQKLWKLFYDSIEIRRRRNYNLRRTHLPKRFWKNIIELKDEL